MKSFLWMDECKEAGSDWPHIWSQFWGGETSVSPSTLLLHQSSQQQTLQGRPAEDGGLMELITTNPPPAGPGGNQPLTWLMPLLVTPSVLQTNPLRTSYS